MVDDMSDELKPCPEIVIDTIGGNCPVQAEGTIDGKPFYFRARGGHWSMSIGGEDVIGSPEWYFSAPYPDPKPSKLPIYDKQPQDGGVVVGEHEMSFAAGWMDESAARSFIHTAAVLYANTRALGDRGIPEGWKLVPIKSTREMNQAADMTSDAWNVWDAMVAASPATPAPEASNTTGQCANPECPIGCPDSHCVDFSSLDNEERNS